MTTDKCVHKQVKITQQVRKKYGVLHWKFYCWRIPAAKSKEHQPIWFMFFLYHNPFDLGFVLFNFCMGVRTRYKVDWDRVMKEEKGEQQ